MLCFVFFLRTHMVCCIYDARLASFTSLLVSYILTTAVFDLERTRPAANMRLSCLIYLSASNEARRKERSDRDRFLPIPKKASSYRGAYRVASLN